MKHIAIVTTGLVGITNISIQLISRLKKEGFKITYLCPFNTKEVIESHGIDYIQLPEINFNFSFSETATITSKSLGTLQKYAYHFTHTKKQYDEGIAMLNFDSYEKTLNQLKPDLILIDQELHEIIFASIKLKIPVKLISHHLFNEMQIGLPSIRTDIIPGIGFRGSNIGIMLSWFYFKLKIWGRVWMNRIRLKENRRSILKYYAKQIGFPRKHLISRNFPSVFINSFLPTLSVNILELEFPFSKPENWTYIGAMILENRFVSIQHQETASHVASIINLKKKNNSRLIYCSLTTMSKTSDGDFIKNLIEAVRNEPNWVLILSLGGKFSSYDVNELPKNVHLFKWVPQLDVLKDCDCSINHGGINTIHECILYKVPMLVYSGKKFDQSGCAARIAYHGLGLIGDKDLDDSKTINAKISKILTNGNFKENSNKIHAIQKNYESKKLSTYL